MGTETGRGPVAWGERESPWVAAVEEAWAAFGADSLPVGAAFAAGGRVRWRARHRVYGHGGFKQLRHGIHVCHGKC